MASVDAATVEEVVGVCLLVQPELIVAAVVVIGVVIVAAAIAAELENEKSCKEWFTECLGTRIASIPGPKYGHVSVTLVWTFVSKLKVYGLK